MLSQTLCHSVRMGVRWLSSFFPKECHTVWDEYDAAAEAEGVPTPRQAQVD